MVATGSESPIVVVLRLVLFYMHLVLLSLKLPSAEY